MRNELQRNATRTAIREPALRVGSSRDLGSAPASRNLLFAFHFGAGPAPVDHPSLVSPGLAPTDGKDAFECWWYAGPVGYRTDGNIRIAECDDYTVAVGEIEACTDIEAETRELYAELLAALSCSAHAQPVKIWNYIGEINKGNGDAERYRRFSVGRAEAFDAAGIEDTVSPTGTAIGSNDGTGLTVIAIGSENAYRRAENPRQVSAFHYPRQFGPSSPRFGRGGYVNAGDHRLYLLSGTASVVGYDSMHPYDAQRQVAEIVDNLDALRDSLAADDSEELPLNFGDTSMLRAYVRNPADGNVVAKALRTALGVREEQLLVLKGDICRRELMVELDGIEVR